MTTITMTEARTLFRSGNNAGNGYSPTGDTVEGAAAEIGQVILSRETSDDVAVVLDGDKLIAIGGDSAGRNAWAVEIVNHRKIAKLRDEAGQAGDDKMVAICDRADAGDRDALIECARVMADWEAQR